MAVPDRFVAWCKQEQDSIRHQLERFETGQLGTYEVSESGRTDTTATTMEQLKMKLVALDGLLLEAGELP